MSHYSVETFLYDLAYKAGNMERFHAQRDGLYAEYYLSDAERADIDGWNVKQLHEQGVSPMLLLLCYTAVYGIEKRGEYLVKMGQQAKAEADAALRAEAPAAAEAPSISG